MKFPIVKEGFTFIILGLILSLISFGFGVCSLGYLFIFLIGFFAFFFRQPTRKFVMAEDKIYAPADGKVILVSEEFEENIFRQEVIKISIFMSVFNVHINYAPISGVVTYIKHSLGAYHRANILTKEERNENNLLGIKNNLLQVGVRQVAGLIARRIVCDCTTGDQLTAGKRFGMVKFGSRVDLYIPKNWQVNVTKGETVRAVKTVIASKKV